MPDTMLPSGTDTVELTRALVRCESVTPREAGALQLLEKVLTPLGFRCERMDFTEKGTDDVANLYARVGQDKDGNGKHFCFAGHSDVVPVGDLSSWTIGPFAAELSAGYLFGRGAADMKGAIAAFTDAGGRFLARRGRDFGGSISLLITGDEEGPAINGTVKVVDLLESRGTKIDYCMVGEPTSVDQLGDMIKNGRRGSLSGKLRIKGTQAHIAYPHLGKNPIHLAAPAIAALVETEWDKGNEYFQPTSFQISNVHAGTGANNVIPGELVIDFNFRFSTESKPEQLRERLEKALSNANLDFEIDWVLGGSPFITGEGDLANALRKAIKSETQIDAELSTTGGTSDGRFIAKICKEVVEFGPLNATSHKIDECVNVDDVEPLKNIYRKTLEQLIA